MTSFNDAHRHVSSWYVAARSAAVRAGAITPIDMLGRRLALYRDSRGCVHAVDARCPHLGANIAHGRVVGEGITCAFHGWQFDASGACVAAPAHAEPPHRRLRVYPTLERWGLVWVFNGAAPTFDLPEIPAAGLAPLHLPPRTIRAHPHLVIANGLDIAHFSALHDLDLLEPPQLSCPAPHMLRLDVRVRPRVRWPRGLLGDASGDASFTTYGGTIALASIYTPITFHTLFTGRTTPEGGCRTGTLVFVPRAPRRALQALVILIVMLRQDRRILDDLAFMPAFSEADAGLRTFMQQVNQMESW